MISEKQKSILEHITQNGSITKKKAVELIGHNYYHNASKYVGEVLSRMVNRKLIKRIKPGLFERGDLSGEKDEVFNPNQTEMNF